MLRPYSQTACGVPIRRPFLQRNFTANQSPNSGRLSRLMKPRRAIQSVAVAQCQRAITETHGFSDKIFRLRSSFEKTEAGSGMEFEIHEASQLAVTVEF
jgi:hypothetical protein